MLRSLVLRFVVLGLALVASSFAQTGVPDKSGNGLLNGSYNFRYVMWNTADLAGNLGSARTTYGVIRFDGAGRFTATAQVTDSSQGAGPFSFAGGYSITAAGAAYMDHPFNAGALVYGMVSNGVFVGSSTESILNDLFVLAPQSSTSAGGFNGKYAISEISFPSASIGAASSSLITIQPNGLGSLGTVTASTFTGPLGTEATASPASATYTLSLGVGTLNYGTTAAPSTRTLYISPDGNFIFGGSPGAFDFFVGVKLSSGAPPIDSVKGLYYHAGVSVDESTLGSLKFAEWESYWGAVSYQRGVVADDATAVVPVGHNRQLNGVEDAAVDYTYSDQYSPDADGSFFYFSERRRVSADGNYIIGAGFSQFLGLEIAVKAPAFTGSGVFLNPAGIVNAASSAPFTAGLSRGEFLTLYGTNLAPKLDINTDFPRTLSGVQVLVNNRPAPLYFVSPTQISLVVPYSTNELLANVQVVNNGVASNTTSLFVKQSTPGIFTKPYPGFGQAAALHTDFSEITQANPARPGEVIQVFMAGLGDVTPPITEGDLSPASLATSKFAASVDGFTVPDADLTYAGLAPQLRGLYQMNLKIPASVGAGNKYLDIRTPGAIHSQAKVWITTSAAGKSEPSLSEAQVERTPRGHLRMGPRPTTLPNRPASRLPEKFLQNRETCGACAAF
jgi:uncharacterized protein (TIGR03437 family)